jgi:hypothetical protein
MSGSCVDDAGADDFRRERAGEVDEHRAQVRAVAQQVVSADACAEEESHRRLVAFGCVAARTRKDKVVASIEGRLPLSRARRDRASSPTQ